jgi:hypothetical protein
VLVERVARALGALQRDERGRVEVAGGRVGAVGEGVAAAQDPHGEGA